MSLRVLRVGVGMLLSGSGALMFAASWQRWSGACSWGDPDARLCTIRQDHLYDFLAPSAPWQPVGDAAQLAGSSLLVLALAYGLLPWALTGRRPGMASAVAQVGALLATGAVGVATIRSGLIGTVVTPVADDLTLVLWLVLPPVFLLRFAVACRGWSLAAAIGLILATPILAGFTYAVGPYDARPWWEAFAGSLTITAGLCLLGAAAFTGRMTPNSLARVGVVSTHCRS